MICMRKAGMMSISMHRLRRKRILINFKINIGKYVNNLLEMQNKANEYEVKNEKSVDKFERSGYNRSKERLKTENT